MPQTTLEPPTRSQGFPTGNQSPFKHDPLDQSLVSIRLIHFVNTLSTEGLIKCRLYHSTTSTKYICLSYRWGDATPLRPILINDRTFWIRCNLHEFMTMARSHPERTDGLPYWIDALSIQQDD